LPVVVAGASLFAALAWLPVVVAGASLFAVPLVAVSTPLPTLPVVVAGAFVAVVDEPLGATFVLGLVTGGVSVARAFAVAANIATVAMTNATVGRLQRRHLWLRA
jgi:hypothetical protein